MQWVISYDPDTGTKHLNPIYEKDNWYKGFDVVVHDECCSDVKDLTIIGKILKPHRDGLPGVVLHCGMHSYRSEGFPKEDPMVRVHRSGQHRARAAVADAISFVDKESPITKGMADWKTVNEELYNNSAGKLLETAKPLARGNQSIKGKDGKERTETMSSPGRTPTTARPRCSPPHSATTMRRLAMTATSIWSPAACCGRSGSSTRPTEAGEESLTG